MAIPFRIKPTPEEERRHQAVIDVVLRNRAFLKELVACCTAIIEASEGSNTRRLTHPHIQDVLRIRGLAQTLRRFESKPGVPRLKKIPVG